MKERMNYPITHPKNVQVISFQALTTRLEIESFNKIKIDRKNI